MEDTHKPHDGTLLRVFCSQSDRCGSETAYEAIILAAREQGLAGATAIHGLMGFGATSRVHTAKVLRLSEDLPVVVEIVDRTEAIEAFLPTLEKIVEHGLVTTEPVRVITYRSAEKPD